MKTESWQKSLTKPFLSFQLCLCLSKLSFFFWFLGCIWQCLGLTPESCSGITPGLADYITTRPLLRRYSHQERTGASILFMQTQRTTLRIRVGLRSNNNRAITAGFHSVLCCNVLLKFAHCILRKNVGIKSSLSVACRYWWGGWIIAAAGQINQERQ